MKEGAIFGALVALFVYVLLPIYGNNGEPAALLPTANAVKDPSAYSAYVANLPFSMVIFFGLEILGISAGIGSQLVLRKFYKTGQ